MKCGNCKRSFDENENIFWDESSTASVKLTKCPNCNTIKVLKYVPDSFCRKQIERDIRIEEYYKRIKKEKKEEKEINYGKEESRKNRTEQRELAV